MPTVADALFEDLRAILRKVCEGAAVAGKSGTGSGLMGTDVSRLLVDLRC
jgi:hypothetical protein